MGSLVLYQWVKVEGSQSPVNCDLGIMGCCQPCQLPGRRGREGARGREEEGTKGGGERREQSRGRNVAESHPIPSVPPPPPPPIQTSGNRHSLGG